MPVTERRNAVMLVGRCFGPSTEVEQTQRWVSPLCPWEAEKEAGSAWSWDAVGVS